MTKRYSCILVLFLLLGCAGTVHAATRFGLVYDIKGSAELTTPFGKTTRLERGRHILMPVKVGDRIKTADGGSVIVVALASRVGYEIASNSEARVENGEIAAVRGEVKSRSGYTTPSGQSSGPIGAMVFRGGDSPQCLTAVSPSNTSIVTLTPELKWTNSCADVKRVTVRILEDRKVVFEKGVSGDTAAFAVPSGLLKHGRTYNWIVDAGQTTAGVEADFSTLTQQQMAAVAARIAGFDSAEKDVPRRISHLFYLMDNDLKDNARLELERLQRDFPDNAWLKDL